VLVATDIAARGIDVEEISHVINYELPNVPETYVHRIGRTARAGKSGVAISLCDGEERAYLRDIERLIRRTIAVVRSENAPATPAPPPQPTPARPRPNAKQAARDWHRRRHRAR
jgi:ATP-dependent RNA helicase RhlE